MIKSLSCNPISDDNQISNENINISFQEFNDNNYQIEVFKNSNFEQDLIKIKENHHQTLNLLNKINNEIQQFKNLNIENNKFVEQNEKNTNISNILEWSTNIGTITAGITAPLPIIGTAASSISTITAGACAIANSIIKNKTNYKKIEDLKMQNDDNNIFIQKENNINSIDLQNQPSTSSGHRYANDLNVARTFLLAQQINNHLSDSSDEESDYYQSKIKSTRLSL